MKSIFLLLSTSILIGQFCALPLKAQIRAIIPDFQVNENTGPNGASQYHPSIATDSSGNCVIAWVDWRNGTPDIFAQQFSRDGTAIGENFKVNDDERCHDQYHPIVSMDKRGNFIIAWKDDRNDGWDIYGQRYSIDESEIGDNFRVSDVQGSAWQFSVAMNATGEFIITWANYHSEQYDIYAQRYSADGLPVGDNFRVNDDTGDERRQSPAVSFIDNGDFVIAWEDWSEDEPTIFTQRYSNEGKKIGSNFKLNDDSMDDIGNPVIQIDSEGNFVTVWQDYSHENVRMYAQRYLSDGTAVGDRIHFSAADSNANHQYASIAVDRDGNFLIGWIDDRNGYWDWDVFGQRYTKEGIAIGNNFRTNTIVGSACEKRPSIALDLSGSFYFAWSDEWLGDYDIFLQRYSNDGIKQDDNLKVNDDEGSADQSFPSIATDANGNFVITWIDQRHGKPDTYARRFSYEGVPIGDEFKVNNDNASIYGFQSLIAMDKNGNFVISWIEGENPNEFPGFDIIAQRYSNTGQAIGDKIIVNEVGIEIWSAAIIIDHSISMDGDSNFVITWTDSRNLESSSYDIYAQRFSSNGMKIGDNFKVNDDIGNCLQHKPCVAMNRNGQSIITWVDGRNLDSSSYDIYAQLFSGDGIAMGSNFKVNDDEGNYRQSAPSVAMDDAGNFVIAWLDRRNETPTLFAQRYSADGKPSGTNFEVIEPGTWIHPFLSRVASDNNGNFVIMWVGYGDEYDIYARCYSNDGIARGETFLVTNISKMIQREPDMKVWNGRMYTTWSDNRAGGTGFDIWANVLDWSSLVDVREGDPLQVPLAHDLHQNYPNPFNSSTTIKYVVAKPGVVKLKIYDVLGNEVQVLVNEFQRPGIYSAKFDATRLPSNIYFYRLEMDEFVRTRKMLYVK